MGGQENAEMSFLEHLEELRWHIIRSFSSIFIFAILAFIFRGFIFDIILLAPKNPEFITNRILCHLGKIINTDGICINSHALQLININMSGQFSTHIMISMFAGAIVSFPYIFWEFWKFISPALYENERNSAKGAVLYTSFLFLIGVLFGYFIISPLSVNFLGSYQVSEQVINQINLGSYISTVSSIVLASGVVFELPILIYFLSKIGLVTPKFLKEYRRHSIIIILIIAAIITPPDVFSQILVSIPLIILYEVSIVISGKVLKRKEAEML